MQRALLTRQEDGDQGTFGQIAFDGQPIGVDGCPLPIFTVELPWRKNAPNISCIPAGIYLCRWLFSPHFRRMMYGVLNVPGRSGVRIHPANLAGDRALGFKSQLYGCVALGEKLGWLGGQKAVLVSRPAVSALELAMAGQDFELEIKNGTDW